MALSMGRAPNIVATVAWFCLYASCVLAQPDVDSEEITFEQEEIFVNVVDGSTFSLMVEPGETVEELQQDILDFAAIPPVYQLMKDDTELDLYMQMSGCNIRNGTELFLKIHDTTSSRVEEFRVRTLDGKELKVRTQLRNSVASLKDTIEQQTGITHVQQRLLLRGKELKDESMLAQFDIRYGTTINLGRPLEDCRRAATISVKTFSGATFRVGVNLADPVVRLKQKIFEKAGIPVIVQRLFAYERPLAGEDHLCDQGLEDGSIVYMFLYSTRIESIDQVAKLREIQPVAESINPEIGPIFREVEDGRSPGLTSIFKDARNWVTRSDRLTGSKDHLFDPVAHLTPNPDDEEWIQRNHKTIENYSRTDASDIEHMDALFLRARIKVSLALRAYRLAANLTSSMFTQSPGITLGGGFADVIPKQMVPLRADVNNWAPDAFSDSDVMRLFEVAERVRHVLARSARTGDGILTIASQSRINRVILLSYYAATYAPLAVCNQAREDEECTICQDDITSEPAIRLPCEHAFHTDCILTWFASLFNESTSRSKPLAPSCPYCRSGFLIPYELLGKAELEKPELQVNYNE